MDILYFRFGRTGIKMINVVPTSHLEVTVTLPLSKPLPLSL